MLSSTTLAITALLTLTSALPTLESRDAAIRNSPTGSYAPAPAVCPIGLAIRRPTAAVPLNPGESSYILAKTANAVPDWTAYLKGVALTGLNVSSFVPSAAHAVPGKTLPIISFAVSGGGTRAMLVGGGMLAGFDNRNATVVKAKTGGVLQLATYLAGLSGGSWMTGSYALSGFPSFEAMRDQVWALDESLLGPNPSHPTMDADAAYSIKIKAAAGYPVSFVDAYGRLLSYHLTNDTQPATNFMSGPGAATLWSSIRSTPLFKKKLAPFPIIITLGRQAGQINLTIASPIYEVTPFEFGTDVPLLSPAGYVPIDYLGSRFQNGSPSNPLVCTVGFENAGLLMGSSGNIVGAPLQLAEQTGGTPDAFNNNPAIIAALATVPDDVIDTTRVPNPFKGLGAGKYPASNDVDLGLADAGLAGENIPFWPLLTPNRKVDVIVAVDASADTNNFPDGQEIYHTYQKSLQPGYGAFPFPLIPEPVSFQAQGLHKRPVFFGTACTGQMPKTPLIVYLPNYNVVYATNTSTGTTSYPVQEQQSFYDNSFAIATQSHALNSTAPAWTSCLACALVDAQQTRNGHARSAQCGQCFDKYCFRGSK